MKTGIFSERLKIAMDAAQIHAAELGRICSISKSTMSQYMSGKYEPKHDRILLISRALGCSPEWLSGHDSPMHPVVSSDSGGGSVPIIASVNLSKDNLFTSDSIVSHELAEEIYCDGHHFVIIAPDDSMDPMIMPGDHVLCERTDHLENGQTGIFILPDGSAAIRTYECRDGARLMVSFNRYFPPRSFDEANGVHIVGRVIRSTRYW